MKYRFTLFLRATRGRKALNHKAPSLLLCLGLILLAACGDKASHAARAKTAEAGSFDTTARHPPLYTQQVRPILEKRCVVCHACYDAPCQLKLSSIEGIARGANSTKVYDGSRVLAAEPTRLFIDASTTEQWRNKGFFTVLGSSGANDNESLMESVFARMLVLKQSSPMPTQQDGRLSETFDLSLNRDWQCPSAENFDHYAENASHAGMPYGLPSLNQYEYSTLTQWLSTGAQLSAAPELSNEYTQAIEKWEAFFNQSSKRGQLVARYLYEHLFLANIYFPELPGGHYFRLYRSKTPPGEPLDLIATRRPFDDPGIKRVYYRLERSRAATVAKNHIPYALNSEQFKRLNQLFFDVDYPVTQLPGYDEGSISNPFSTFRALPARSRYLFMLEQAQFTIRGFMKGSVCRGQVALNVIDDHFWVIFTDPDQSPLISADHFLEKEHQLIDLPNTDSNEFSPASYWLTYGEKQQAYLLKKKQLLENFYSADKPLTLDAVWRGDGKNENAALTVFRHFDSASVVKGFQGLPPKTTWLIDYPILERIHYLLVAGFDVYGNVSHQLITRLHMDFLRMESEQNFLALLPQGSQTEVQSHWYRNADDDVKEFLSGAHSRFNLSSNIEYKTGRHQEELYKKLAGYLANVLSARHSLAQSAEVPTHHYQSLRKLEELRGKNASLLPELALLLVEGANGDVLYTVTRNSAHINISGLFDEASRRLPKEDTVTVLPGVVAAYPDAFWKTRDKELDAFVTSAMAIRDEQDYRRFMADFGVRRSNTDFWLHSDRVHSAFKKFQAVDYGLLDYNRLENR